jgi:hypothetical protein
MRILRVGHIKPKIIICTGCGAELEYTKSDVNYSQILDVRSIVCSLCCKRLIITK